MNDVLTFRAPQPATPRVTAMPSPTLELAYAFWRLGRSDSARSVGELPWLQRLHTEHPQVVQAMQSLQSADHAEAGFDLLWFVCEMGFAVQESVKPFFADFAVSLEAFVKRVETQRQRMRDDPEACLEEEIKDDKYASMLHRLETLRDEARREAFLSVLRQLWAALEGMWVTEGLELVQRSVESFESKFAESGGVLEALPSHHFVQFEGSAREIRASLEKGRLVVVPLFFATGGGFNLDFQDTHFLGYGIHAEVEFERLQAQSSSAAGRMKALGDPTRLLLLSLLARYSNFVLTVSDLAAQLGVSQPTASAHLKLLKDNGLVTLERKGNKSFYRVDNSSLEGALEDLRALLRLK
jgi:ArsR family transcriptional regulator, arsenate/arsenite/antimonite-responsive transcriptional repressor